MPFISVFFLQQMCREVSQVKTVLNDWKHSVHVAICFSEIIVAASYFVPWLSSEQKLNFLVCLYLLELQKLLGLKIMSEFSLNSTGFIFNRNGINKQQVRTLKRL